MKSTYHLGDKQNSQTIDGFWGDMVTKSVGAAFQ